MRPLLHPEEMSAADEAAIERGTPAFVLMERAGRALARVAIELAGGRYGKRALVVCGKGNNGGDGFAAARFLIREGVLVRCLTVVDVGEIEGAAAEHLGRLQASGCTVQRFAGDPLGRADVIVDAIFGTGFRGVVEGVPATAIDLINESDAPVVSADIPSGVAGATGRIEGPAVKAAVTVAMAAEKYGTATGEGAARSGRVIVAEIGIPVSNAAAGVADESDVGVLLPRRAPDAHKRSGGAVAVLAGSTDMTGAAVLVAQGAARSGSGYVTVGGVRRVIEVVQNSLFEVLAKSLGDRDVLTRDSLSVFEEVIERADALAVGPGLGRGDSQLGLVESLLDEVSIPVVLDADGLNVLGKHTEALSRRSEPMVITPHPAELARLLEISTEDVQADRMGAARKAATEFGCVVLLKGFRTVVAKHDGAAVVNPTGGPELATAGTGDVLTGVVAALLAAGLVDFEAAWAGAFIHGKAGSIASSYLGSSGVLAGDVADALPEALLSLG